MSLIKDIRAIRYAAKPRGLIDEHLPIVSELDGFEWSSRNEEVYDVLGLVCEAFDSAGDESLGFIEVLKKKIRGRCVMRVRDTSGTCVLKGFDFAGSLGKQLYRHRLYALDEALGLLLAADRGVAVPKVLSYGERKAGLRRLSSIVVMEDVENAFHPGVVFRGEEDLGLSIEDVLDRIRPLILQLYEAGCNHIDLHGSSFLLNRSDANLDKVIDFQFAVFHPEPSLKILTHQLVHFSKAPYESLESDMLETWASSVLHEVCSGKDHAEWMRVYREEAAKPGAGRFERMMIRP